MSFVMRDLGLECPNQKDIYVLTDPDKTVICHAYASESSCRCYYELLCILVFE